MNFNDKVVYQIYPKSFRDTNGDGFGDLPGVIEKLDYLAGLGVDYLWLTPVFPSPQNDNGYDVSDYRDIDPRYGTMDDFERLVAEADARGMGIMLDMVLNHTSTEHEWFQRALAGDPKYQDYYFFRDGKPGLEGQPGSEPTNWQSKFGGPAWNYVPELGKYYLHVFDPTQADLDWSNPEVREEAANVLRFWMGKGVRGFRFDVVNLISKTAFEDCEPGGDGREHYTDQPLVHEYLRELNERTFGQDPGIITVGEMSSTTLENSYGYAGADTHELSMVFSFHHLKTDFMGNEKWVLVPSDFDELKRIIFEWQTQMEAHNATNAVFWCNHDQPRVVSRFGDEGEYWRESAKMLGTVVHCLRGTPYIYQGEELGMTNAGFTDLSQYRDVESLNHYQILRDKGISETGAYEILRVHSRDNSRTPMQWDASARAGFMDENAEGEPWIGVNPNYSQINAAAEVGDAESIYAHYQRLVALRHELPVIVDGTIEPLAEHDPSVFAYRRVLGEHELVVVNNFFRNPYTWESGLDLDGFACVLSNYDDAMAPADGVWRLRPYESTVWYR